MLPTAPDVRSLDESESNISPNAPEHDGESEGQIRARERRNKLKEGRKHSARQRKEAHDAYKIELAEYHKRKSKKEAKERRAARVREAPYDKIQALEELKAISHPNEEQEQLQKVIRTTTLRAHGGRTHSRLPARTASHEQDEETQRRSAFERLGPNGSQNREKRRDHAQSNQVEPPREERRRASHRSSPQFISRLNNNWQEEGVVSEHREVRTHDRFPCFSR
jgi:hypothetical protein